MSMEKLKNTTPVEIIQADLKDKEKFAKEIGFILKRKNKKAEIKTKAGQKKLIKN